MLRRALLFENQACSSLCTRSQRQQSLFWFVTLHLVEVEEGGVPAARISLKKENKVTSQEQVRGRKGRDMMIPNVNLRILAVTATLLLLMAALTRQVAISTSTSTSSSSSSPAFALTDTGEVFSCARYCALHTGGPACESLCAEFQRESHRHHWQYNDHDIGDDDLTGDNSHHDSFGPLINPNEKCFGMCIIFRYAAREVCAEWCELGLFLIPSRIPYGALPLHASCTRGCVRHLGFRAVKTCTHTCVPRTLAHGTHLASKRF